MTSKTVRAVDSPAQAAVALDLGFYFVTCPKKKNHLDLRICNLWNSLPGHVVESKARGGGGTDILNWRGCAAAK